ncbi:hypothetical protein [Streptomyces triticirhizae]|uniref:Uncharacterized protein n=1 Tax=Streptomyces triticirhizae TaxID=2483353 RepID=A0A3M2M473_9ACTN|nr:hypothetical protein [Streptomyces triticirhizae]RMI44419.1 hypothetical protein EBN88_05305 [Streptomyces triticirhizae]
MTGIDWWRTSAPQPTAPQPPADPQAGHWWDALYDDPSTGDVFGVKQPAESPTVPVKTEEAPEGTEEAEGADAEEAEGDGGDWGRYEPAPVADWRTGEQWRKWDGQQLATRTDQAAETARSVWRYGGRHVLWLGASASLGWYLGWPQWQRAWITDLGEADSIGLAIGVGAACVGVCLLPAAWARRLGQRLDNLTADAIDHPFRLFAPLLGWVGAVPLVSAAIGLCLYAPAAL